MLSEEEAERIKQEIIKQIDSWHASKEQKSQAREQIESLSNEELESFLSKNKLIKQEKECIFCSIAENKTNSYKLAEDKNNLAVLEINPLSQGHALIIPKKHNSLPEKDFAEKTAEKIRLRLKPKSITQEETELAGHKAISLIPDYGEKLERKKAPEEELKKLQKILESRCNQKIMLEEKKQEKPQPKKLEKAPKRFP